MPRTYKKMTEAEAALAAETRAVEEGHRAYLDMFEGAPAIRVVSDTTPDRWFYVKVKGTVDGKAFFECRANDPEFIHGSKKLLPCKHAAVAARRFEREGLLVWDNELGWLVAPAYRCEFTDQSDPFEGLPS